MNRLITLLDNDLCANLATALLHSLWQAVAIAGLLLLFLRSKAAKDSNVRYTAALTSLTAILLCGLFTWAVLESEPAATAEAPSVAFPGKEVVSTTEQVQTGQRNLGVAEALEPEDSWDGSVRSNWRAWAISVWLIGVAAMLLRVVCTAVGGARLRRRCKPLEDEHILALVEQLRKSIGITRRIRISISEHVSVPGVIGCVWPTLLLPVSMASGIPADDLRAIVAHELAHVRRYDYLVNFCQMIIEAIFFFNPAVWWISKLVRFEREACCDKVGVAATGRRIRYAEVLADWAQRLSDTSAGVAAPAIAFGRTDDSSGMLERVRRIVLVGHRPRLKVSWYIATTTLILSLGVLIGLWRGTTMTVALAGTNVQNERGQTPLHPIGMEGHAAVTTSDMSRLIAALSSIEWSGEREQAAITISKIGAGAQAAIPALIEWLEDEQWHVRRAAATALTSMGPTAGPAVPALTKALADEEWQVRRVAAEAVAAIGPASKPAVPALIKLLGDEEWQARRAAAEALAAIGPASASAVPPLIVVLDDVEWHVRQQAAEALAAIGPASASAVPPLIVALDDVEWHVRRRAAEALASIGTASKPATPRLIAALNDEEWQVRRPAALALGAIGPAAAKAIPTLIKMLEDPEWQVRHAIADALEKISVGDKSSVPEIIEALLDPEWKKRQSAAQSLQESLQDDKS